MAVHKAKPKRLYYVGLLAVKRMVKGEIHFNQLGSKNFCRKMDQRDDPITLSLALKLL